MADSQQISNRRAAFSNKRTLVAGKYSDLAARALVSLDTQFTVTSNSGVRNSLPIRESSNSMVFRNLASNLKARDWGTVVLELFVVFVSVFAAFQVDRWNEDRKIAANVSTHLHTLLADFAENERRLRQTISWNERQKAAAALLREQIRLDVPTISVGELNNEFSELARLPSFEAVDLAYRNLISTGEIASVGDVELRNQLASFYAYYDQMKLIQNTQELQFVTTFQPYAIKNLDYAATVRSVFDAERTQLQPYIDPELILQAMKTKEFENVVVADWEMAMDLGANYDRLLRAAMAIEDRLAAMQ